MSKFLTSKMLCDAVDHQINDYEKYIHGTMASFNFNDEFLLKYVDDASDELLSFALILYTEDLITVREYDYLCSKVQAWYETYDVKRAISDPDFVQAVKNAVEKYGTIN